MSTLRVGCPICRKQFSVTEPLPEEVTCPACYIAFRMPLLQSPVDKTLEERCRTLRNIFIGGRS